MSLYDFVSPFNVQKGISTPELYSGHRETYIIGVPFDLLIGPGEVFLVELGLSCERCLHLFELKEHRAAGLRLDSCNLSYDAGEDVVIGIRNLSDEEIYLSQGADIVAASPMS